MQRAPGRILLALARRVLSGAESVAGLALLVGVLRIGGFVTPNLSTERIFAEWLGLVGLFCFALIATRTADHIGRKRRPALEARALELFQALPQDRHAHLIGR